MSLWQTVTEIKEYEMAYTHYPKLRNYKKRCQIYTRRLNVENERNALLKALDSVEDDAVYDSEFARIITVFDSKIKYLMKLEKSLEYPDTRNEWFCGIISELGAGRHNISRRQAECFSKYFESDCETERTHKLYCRAAGYFCTLYDFQSIRFLEIEIL